MKVVKTYVDFDLAPISILFFQFLAKVLTITLTFES